MQINGKGRGIQSSRNKGIGYNKGFYILLKPFIVILMNDIPPFCETDWLNIKYYR